jgi:hypothetical protein
MGWEQRGANRYYYRKERDGSRVKSVYVGRGEIAHMISQIQSTSTLLERLAKSTYSLEAVKSQRAQAAMEQTSDLVRLITQAALLSAGFHIHKRQWRKRRNVASD